ncbi:MAG: hypothetical protein MK085_05310 [Phycisphaerales bacterium]|nr:hypothetical protein [Phycisphaerales bacterium]
MRDADGHFSAEDIRLLLASIDETIDGLEDWEFPARTGFDRSDFDAIRHRLQRLGRQA